MIKLTYRHIKIWTALESLEEQIAQCKADNSLPVESKNRKIARLQNKLKLLEEEKNKELINATSFDTRPTATN